MKSFKTFICERGPTSLSAPELKKRPWRIELFHLKQKSKSPFQLVDGSQVILTDKNFKFLDINSIAKFGGPAARSLKLTDVDGKEYTLTQFAKTSEFGGGGGSGAGAAQTALAEAAFCVVTSCLLKFKKFSFDPIKLNKINVDIGKTSIDEVVNFLKGNPDWYDATLASAEVFIKETGISPSARFHRDSRFFGEIYNEFKRLLNDVNYAKLRIGTDKWNPGDVWVSNGVSSIPKFDSIEGYNIWLKEQFDSNKLIGVSLKKTGSSPRISVIGGDPAPELKFKAIEPQKSALGSKDAYILGQAGSKIQIRNFNAKDNVQAEVKGKSASHGKIGFGNISYFLQFFDGTKIPTKKEIENMPDQEFLDYLKAKTGFSASVEELQNKPDPLDYKISKFQALFIADTIKNSKNKDKIFNAIVNYAKSQGGVAGLFEPSVYYKIY